MDPNDQDRQYRKKLDLKFAAYKLAHRRHFIDKAPLDDEWIARCGFTLCDMNGGVLEPGELEAILASAAEVVGIEADLSAWRGLGRSTPG